MDQATNSSFLVGSQVNDGFNKMRAERKEGRKRGPLVRDGEIRFTAPNFSIFERLSKRKFPDYAFRKLMPIFLTACFLWLSIGQRCRRKINICFSKTIGSTSRNEVGKNLIGKTNDREPSSLFFLHLWL